MLSTCILLSKSTLPQPLKLGFKIQQFGRLTLSTRQEERVGSTRSVPAWIMRYRGPYRSGPAVEFESLQNANPGGKLKKQAACDQHRHVVLFLLAKPLLPQAETNPSGDVRTTAPNSSDRICVRHSVGCLPRHLLDREPR